MTEEYVPERPTQFFAPGWYTEPTTGLLRWWDGQAWGAYAPTQTRQPVGLSTAALCVGIAAMLIALPSFFSATYLGLFLTAVPGATAVAMGAASSSQARKAGRSDRMAESGIALGGVAIIIASAPLVMFWW